MKTLILILMSVLSLDVALARLDEKITPAPVRPAADVLIQQTEDNCKYISLEGIHSLDFCHIQARAELLESLISEIYETRLTLYTIMSDARLSILEQKYISEDQTADNKMYAKTPEVNQCDWKLGDFTVFLNYNCTLDRQKEVITLQLQTLTDLDKKIRTESTFSPSEE